MMTMRTKNGSSGSDQEKLALRSALGYAPKDNSFREQWLPGVSSAYAWAFRDEPETAVVLTIEWAGTLAFTPEPGSIENYNAVMTEMRQHGFTEAGLKAQMLRAEEPNQGKLPVLVLPGGSITITECADNIFGIIAPTKRLFVRGGAVVSLVTRDDGMLALEVLKPAAARSAFEKFARLYAERTGRDGERVLKPVNCPLDTADALLQSEEAKKLLPRISGLVNCPVIREIDGQLSVVGPGYDDHTRVFVTGGKMPPVVPLTDAVSQLRALLDEFNFQSQGDEARALVSFISPALKMGGLLKSRPPADVAEADESQSGKTYRQRMIAAIYKEPIALVTNREGGVGSVDESLDQKLIEGRPFIQFDNFRGHFNSAHLEAFLTADGAFPCRVPGRAQISVPSGHYFIFLSSNGVDTTRDLANRSSIIRIRKQAPGFTFYRSAKGEDVLDEIKRHQTYYLGCVFAVIKAWHTKGKPRTSEARHDFREWVQTVDWIAQNIFKTAPVMDGHEQAQQRVSSPELVWLRSVTLAVKKQELLDRAMTATDVISLCISEAVAVPGLRSLDDDRGKKIVGMLMARLFKESATLEVEGFMVTREEVEIERGADSGRGGSFSSKTYTVSRLG